MRLTLLALTLGGTLVQSSVMPILGFAGAAPDVPLVLAVMVALRRGPEAGCLTGFLAGLVQDLTGPGLVGVQALTKAVTGFLAGFAGLRFRVGDPLVQVPGLLLLSAVEGLLRFGVLRLFHYPTALVDVMVEVVLPQTLLNGALGAAALFGLAAVDAVRTRLG
jgi:rod shape-determining protein MreD